VKIIGMLLVVFSVLHASASAQSQVQAKPQGATGSVTSIVTPEEQKIFSSRPSPAPPSLRSSGSGKAPAPSLSTAAGDDPETARLLDQADNQIVQGHAPAAADLFQKALNKYPGQARATFGLAVASSLAGKTDVAKGLFEKLASSPPTEQSDPVWVAWSHVYLGRIYDLAGDKNSAVREYRVAASLVDAPESARAAGQSGLDNHKADEAKTSGQTDAASSATPAVNAEEDAAYAAILAVPTTDKASVDKKIQLGQDFIQKYPSSQYVRGAYEQVLIGQYANQEWSGFYITADKILSTNPDDVDVLTTVGWVIPHQYYNRSNRDAAEKLDKAEAYEKHAIELIPSIPKPASLTDDQFAQVKAEKLSQAHSGLGLVYFRAEDLGNAARELQLSIKGVPVPDPTDVYTLGVVLSELGQNAEAADEFAKCSQIPGDMQDRCKQAAAKMANAK
jgi:Flp pilus assembly protein TadD